MLMNGTENAFEIIGAVESILKQCGRRDEIKDIRKRMMSGDYDNVKKVATEVTYGILEFKE